MKKLSVLVLSNVLLVMGACSRSDAPTNLAPTLTLHEAREVTRTEAHISVTATTHGSGQLTELHFRYGDTQSMTQSTANLYSPGATTFEVTLSGLRPGTSYSYCAEGGNGSATLRSATLTFTTEPNEAPTPTSASILSSAPTAVIVGFEIADDGGEALVEAGCIVAGAGIDGEMRVALDGVPTMGSNSVTIRGLLPECVYTLTPYARNSIGEGRGETVDFTTRRSVELSAPGILASLFGNAPIELDTLTVTGPLNGDDLHFIRRALQAPPLENETPLQSAVTALNISGANIVEGGGPYDMTHFSARDVVSRGLFAQCGALQWIALPLSAREMQPEALTDCCALRSLTIPASMTEVGVSTGCTALEEILTSTANGSYCSIDGVLFNADASAIIWFPMGKSDDYELPPTVTSIGEGAFRGTNIRSITIPPSVVDIGRAALSGCKIREATLPDNLARVPEALFQGCELLAAVRLGAACEYVGNYAFDGTPLADLYLPAELPPVAAPQAFANSAGDLLTGCTLHVAPGLKPLYRNHAQWGKFIKIVED